MIRFIYVAIVALVLSGCATQSLSSLDALDRTEGAPKIVLLPTDITLYVQTAGGALEAQAEWTQQAEQHMAQAIRAHLDDNSIAFEDDFANLTLADMPQETAELIRLHQAIGGSIMAHAYNTPLVLPHKKGEFDWTLGPGIQAIARQTNADYGLFIHLHDSYASAGRVALIVVGAVLGVGVSGGQQIGYASLVDLETGEFVWFNRLIRGTGDVRNYDDAQESIATLLNTLPQ